MKSAWTLDLMLGSFRCRRLVAAGSKRWMYNLLSTGKGQGPLCSDVAASYCFEGPVIVFLTIFLVLLYHLTCVLHSISLAKESLEAAVARSSGFCIFFSHSSPVQEAYYRSVAVGLGSMERSFADQVVARGLCARHFCRSVASA